MDRILNAGAALQGVKDWFKANGHVFTSGMAEEMRACIGDRIDQGYEDLAQPADKGLREKVAQELWASDFRPMTSWDAMAEKTREGYRFMAERALSLLPARAEGWRPPEGWVLVPKEPTEAMIEAGYDSTRLAGGYPQFADVGFCLGHAAEIYCAMAFAAPSPTAGE
jgi:hypothetical protein